MDIIKLPENGNGHSHALTVAVNNQLNESAPFIEANTTHATLKDIQERHIIPTFKDATPLISHADFISATDEMVHKVFAPERIAPPSVRLSHSVHGRIPEAKDKPVSELQDWERTLYYERMAFIIEVNSISDKIEGETLCLTIGGVRKYDNINLRNGADQHFKVFIGYRVSCCTNLCVSVQGLLNDIRVKSIGQLKESIYHLLCEYDAISQLKQMQKFTSYSLTENQFAHFIGKARLYQFLPQNVKSMYPEFLYTDTQINMVCKEYYTGEHFGREFNGEINLWKLYNLLTSSNKSSYIDLLLPRAANALSLVQTMANDLESGNNNWLLI
jgi:hypothetical protein